MQKQRATTIDENKRALETVTNTFASIEARMEQALEAAKASLPQSFVAGGNAPLALAADGTENAKSEKQTGRRGKRKVTDFEEERLLDVEAHPILNPGQKRPARTRRAGAEAAPGVPNQAPVLPPPAQGLAPRKGKAAAGAGGERRGGRVPKPKKKAAGGVRRVKGARACQVLTEVTAVKTCWAIFCAY